MPEFQRLRNEPLLAFIHIPKTGGMSILHWLGKQGCAHLNLFENNTHFAYSEEALNQIIRQSPEVKFLSSHFILTTPPILAGREMLYFTLLRDPIEQVVSYITFIKKTFSHITDQDLLKCLPRDASALSIREFAHWIYTQQREEIPFLENYTVNRLARHHYLSLQVAGGRLDPTEYRSVRLTLAKSVLDRFIYVGLTEHMDESIEQLRKIALSWGVNLPEGGVGVDNTSHELRDDLAWIQPKDEVGAMLLHSVEEDRQLYQWASERFKENFWGRRAYGMQQSMDVCVSS